MLKMLTSFEGSLNLQMTEMKARRSITFILRLLFNHRRDKNLLIILTTEVKCVLLTLKQPDFNDALLPADPFNVNLLALLDIHCVLLII